MPREQAAALVELLEEVGVKKVYKARSGQCLQGIEPFSAVGVFFCDKRSNEPLRKKLSHKSQPP